MNETFINVALTVKYGGVLPNINDPIHATVHKPTPFYVEGTVHAIKSLKWTNAGKLRITVTINATKLTKINNLLVVK